METIKGIVVAIIFEAQDSTYKVLIVKSENEKKTVTGYFPQIDKDACYTFEGETVKHARYGHQFKCSNFTRESFENASGLIYYLSSSRFVGIGEVTACKIVDTLGLDAINKILSDPNCLNSVPGLTKKRADSLKKTIKDNEEINKIFVSLYSYGLSISAANKLYVKYDKNVLNKINENPYILCSDVENFSFKKCDLIARNLKIDLHDLRRINEAVIYTLFNYTYSYGNTFALIDDLIKESIKLLEVDEETFKDEEILESIYYLEQINRIKIVKRRIYPYDLYFSEIESARILKQMLSFKYERFSLQRIEEKLALVETNLDFNLTDEQREAVKCSLRNKISIITGGPGTGKTTILKVILSLYSFLVKKSLVDLYNSSEILLLAPTGRASRRMFEQTGVCGFTIHKALEYSEEHEFNRNCLNKLSAKLVIIDESSMIDIQLFYHLLDALPLNCRVIFLGDINQIPSVGPGNILSDLIDSKLIPVSKLNSIMRQVSDSNIIKLSNSVINQEIDFSIFNEKKEVFFYHLENYEIIPFILKLLHKYKQNNEDFYNDLQILCPMYHTMCGIDKINEAIQSEFNDSIELVKYGNHIFKVGDKVLQTQNNPELELNNGDTGIIKSINKNDKEIILFILFDSNMVRYPYSNLDELTLGYAISIHKAQGSEYKNVIIPVVSEFWIMLRKKLIYTAITRAKEKVIMCGNSDVINKAIKVNEEIRLTSLTRFLTSEEEFSNKDLDSNELDINADLKEELEPTNYIKINDEFSAFDTILEEMNGITPFTCMEELEND